MVDPACPAVVELDKLPYTELIQTTFGLLATAVSCSNLDLAVAVSQKAQCGHHVKLLAPRFRACRLADVQTDCNAHQNLMRSCVVEEMAKLLDADVDLGSLNFQAEFTLSIPLIVSEKPTEMCLKEDTICIAADDDKIMRMGSQDALQETQELGHQQLRNSWCHI